MSDSRSEAVRAMLADSLSRGEGNKSLVFARVDYQQSVGISRGDAGFSSDVNLLG